MKCKICNALTPESKHKKGEYRKTCSKECDSKLRSRNSSKAAKKSNWNNGYKAI